MNERHIEGLESSVTTDHQRLRRDIKRLPEIREFLIGRPIFYGTNNMRNDLQRLRRMRFLFLRYFRRNGSEGTQMRIPIKHCMNTHRNHFRREVLETGLAPTASGFDNIQEITFLS